MNEIILIKVAAKEQDKEKTIQELSQKQISTPSNVKHCLIKKQGSKKILVCKLQKVLQWKRAILDPLYSKLIKIQRKWKKWQTSAPV